MKPMHLITLLLALWAPLNAVSAGASMLDCPMTANEVSEHPADCPSMGGDSSTPASAETGCDHCANCVLLGGFTMPPQGTPPAIRPASVAPDGLFADQVGAGIPSTPFRPPLSA